MRLAIVIPVLNETDVIESTLKGLNALRARGAQVIVVDGGSLDATVARAQQLADSVLHSARGRARQMNEGARAALDHGADVLLFLHADSRLPPDVDRLIESALRTSGRAWGRFDVRIESASPMLKLVSTMINWRSRLTGICTGDQAIFATRDAFERLRGFAPIPLMEDVEFSKRAKAISRPIVIRQRMTTSCRRWQQHGVWRTIWLMWRFRLAYFLGADPQRLADRYRDAR